MNEYSLSEVIEKKLIKTIDLAQKLGVTHGAISQMVRSGRDIRVLIGDNGNLTAYEVKPIPAYSRKAPV